METRDIIAAIGEADLVLVGLGEEFDGGRELKTCPEYLRGLELMREAGIGWLEPAWAEYCLAKVDGVLRLRWRNWRFYWRIKIILLYLQQ